MLNLPEMATRFNPSHVSLQARIHACMSCNARATGLCSALPESESERLALIRNTQCAAPGETLLDEGGDAGHFFTIVSGWVKIYKLLGDGRRQITGFLAAGDILGLAFNGSYSYSAEALTDVTLCRFPRHQFEQLLDRFPKMERRLLAMASHELAQAQDQMVLLGRKTAQERIASFLLSLAARLQLNDAPPDGLHLTMTRGDIADYLGLTTETVSRTFTILRQRGLIELEGASKVRLLRVGDLEDLACGVEAD